ncbi:MAG: hypothetical protein ACI3ZP_04750 [Candidatus Cryptobacteroides sp.]
MRIIISDRICGDQNLINYIEEKLASPYRNDNWDGFRDCIGDLSWLPDESVEIVHESLPLLDYTDMSIYLDILYATERSWRLYKEKRFTFVFPEHLRPKVNDIIHAENLRLFKRLAGSRLYQMQFGFGEDKTLRKVYLQCGSFCISVDENFRFDYYSLSVHQLSDVLEGRLCIPCAEGINNFKTIRKEVKDWTLLDCNLYTDKNGLEHFQANFQYKSLFYKVMDCFPDSNRVFHCMIDNREVE